MRFLIQPDPDYFRKALLLLCLFFVLLPTCIFSNGNLVGNDLGEVTFGRKMFDNLRNSLWKELIEKSKGQDILLDEHFFSMMVPFDYEYTTATTITDGNCGAGGTDIVFNVTDDFTVDDLNVGLVITHTWRDDLDVTLESPDGTVVNLFTDVGGQNDNFNILLDSDAGTNINTVSGNHSVGTPYYNNLFTPENVNALNNFDSKNSVGNWTLNICDDTNQDEGTLVRAILQFEGTLNCVSPTITFSQTPPSCSGSVENDNGSISISTASDATHYGISTLNAGTYDGPTTTGAATPLPGSLPAIIQNNIPNSGGTYIIRIFNNDNDCFIDETITVDAVYCSCSLTTNGLANIACNNNGTTIDPTDDYITFDLNPAGILTAATYNVSVSSGSIAPTSATYGAATTFQLQNGSAGGGNVIVTITDTNDNSCTIDASITDPESCSCQLNIVNLYSEDCVGSGPYTADWKIEMEWDNNPTGNIEVYRNGTLATTHIPVGKSGTATIAGVPADGVSLDTILIRFVNSTACDDQVIATSPTACPSTIPGFESGEICSSVSNTEIAGTVFEDWNYDGVMNDGDTLGILGIQVVLTDGCDENPVATTYTDSNGNYEFTGLNQGTDYRVVFHLPGSVQSWAQPTQAGTDNGSTVQFLQPGNCANLGLASPRLFCQENPPLATTCFTEGSQVGNSLDALVGFSYTAGCVDANLDGTCDDGNQFNTPTPSHIALSSEIGSTWGLAYQKGTRTAFVASFMKRHSGFKEHGKTGVIYKIENPEAASPVISEYVDFDNLGIATRPLTGDPHPLDNASDNDWEVDNNSWDWVGKMSFGDMDIDDDNQTLWTVNLFDRKLYKIPIQSTTLQASDISGFSIPNPCSFNGDMRPFATAFYYGKVYVGLICSGESSIPGVHSGGQISSHVGTRSELFAYVYTFDPVTGFWEQVFDFPLDYARGLAINSSYLPSDGEWNPWVDVFTCYNRDGNAGTCYLDRCYPQPWLTDIEFDRGELILGIRDRFGDQTGYLQQAPTGFSVNQNAQCVTNGTQGLFSGIGVGDILRACGSISDGWAIENNANCGGITTGGANNSGGPGNGEYYFQDNYVDFHDDIGSGGLIQVLGHEDVLNTVIDPINDINEFYDAGVAWYKNSDGTRSRAYLILDTSSGAGGSGNGTFAKANGLGDLEAFCDPAPIEIGNYVWNDTDGDGIQDACESGIDGVTVELVKGGVVIASTTTSNGGYYYFSAASNIGSGTWSGTGADTTILANTEYILRISNAEGGSQQAAVSGLAITTSNANSNTSDLLDSDADLNGNDAEITLTTGGYGSVDHTFDFGFGAPVTCFAIDSLITDRVICSGDAVDTLAVTTSISHPDSIAFVYFTTAQTDSSVIYSSGTGIDTVQISAGNDTVILNNVAVPAFVANGSEPDTFYVYAIAHPAPAAPICRPFDEILVIALPNPEVSTTDESICEGLDVELDTLITVGNSVSSDTSWFISLADAQANINALSSSIVSPTTTTEYYVRLANQANNNCYDIDSLTISVTEIQVNAIQTCSDNGTASDPNDDYFTIELTATNASPGASGQFQVYNGADLLATGTYGSPVTLNYRNAANTLRFLADGTSTYTLTVQDADLSGCAVDETTTAEDDCSDCPTPDCPPVLVTKIPGGN